MTNSRNIEERISLWLEEEAVSHLPDRVLDATFDTTRELRQVGSSPWRIIPMFRSRSSLAAVGAAAVVLIVVGALGLNYFVNRQPGFGASPTVTPTPPATASPTALPAPTAAATSSPAAPPAALALPETDDLEPGRYFLDFDGYRFTFTVAHPGWSGSVEASGIYQGPDEDIAIFWPAGDINSLYRRACDWSGTEFNPGPSVSGLVDDLAALEDFESTVPTDVTVGGYGGKHVALTVPMDVNFAFCDEGNFRRDPGRHYQANGQTDEINVLNLSGYRYTVVVSHTPGTSDDVVAQLEELLNSLEISPI